MKNCPLSDQKKRRMCVYSGHVKPNLEFNLSNGIMETVRCVISDQMLENSDIKNVSCKCQRGWKHTLVQFWRALLTPTVWRVG